MPMLDFRDGIVYATLDAIESQIRVPFGTLRRWAREDRWPTRKIHGRRYYLMASVQTSYDSRGRAHRDTRRRLA